MITRIEAKNYRCLRSVSQELGNFHVVAGPNGSGKSTFFEVPRILSAFGRDGLEALWHESAAQQWEELLFLGQGSAFELAIEMAVPERVRESSGQNGKAPKAVRYEVRIGQNSQGAGDEVPQILAENLWLLPERHDSAERETIQPELLIFPSQRLDDFKIVHESGKSEGWKTVARKTKTGNSYFKSEATSWNLQIRNAADESALRSLPSDERFPISNWFRDQLLQGLQHLNLRTDEMRKPCPPLKRGGFLSDGSNLPHVLAELSHDAAARNAWLEHLRTVLPIEDVSVVTREEDKSRYLSVRYQSGAVVPSWHLSDGTLRMLALTALAYQADNGVYFIEEPENGIHPQAMEAVFQSLSSVYEGQVLVATHSPVLVGLIEPRQLLCFSKTAHGETDVVTGDRHPKLLEWKEGLPLSRLYAAGVLS